jgi:hypothetical protein
MTTTTDPFAKILNIFPNKTLTRVTELHSEPNYSTLAKLQRELNSNASSNKTTKGTGIHGHLVLTVSNAEFRRLTNTPAEDDFPHPTPEIPRRLALNATAALTRIFDNATAHFQLFNNVDQTLKNQLLAACPKLFLDTIKDDTTDFAYVTTLEILTHLWTTFTQTVRLNPKHRHHDYTMASNSAN